MDQKELAEYVDQQRWLLNNGLVTDDVKNQLFFCGSIVHRDVQAVELDLKPEDKLIHYTIYVDKVLLKKIDKYNRLYGAKGVFDMWRFKRLLKKEGSLDFQKILSKFVKDFCGPKWTVRVDTVDFNSYVEDTPVDFELGDSRENGSQRRGSDKLSD